MLLKTRSGHIRALGPCSSAAIAFSSRTGDDDVPRLGVNGEAGALDGLAEGDVLSLKSTSMGSSSSKPAAPTQCPSTHVHTAINVMHAYPCVMQTYIAYLWVKLQSDSTKRRCHNSHYQETTSEASGRAAMEVDQWSDGGKNAGFALRAHGWCRRTWSVDVQRKCVQWSRFELCQVRGRAGNRASI